MSWPKVLASRLAGVFRRRRVDRELDDEVRFHLDMQIEDNLKAADVTITDEDRKRIDAVARRGEMVSRFYEADFGPHPFRV